MSDQEQWRPVPGYPDYLVSDTGRVISQRRRQRTEIAGGVVGGYRRVLLYGGGIRKNAAVHRLVAAAFHGPCPDGLQVRHLDGNRLNNHASNLRYGSHADNMQDRLAHGTNPQANKIHCNRGHEFTPLNTYVYRGGRSCRTCKRQRQRDYINRCQFAAANVPTERAA